MSTSFDEFRTATASTHRRAGFEVGVVTAFALVPLVLSAFWQANYQAVDPPSFWQALLLSSGSGQLYFFALSTLGSVAAKIWPSDGLRMSLGGTFNILIGVCLVACGFLLGVDPTLQRTRTDFVTLSSVFLFLLSLLMLYYTTVCDRLEAPNLEKRGHTRANRLKAQIKQRVEGKTNGE